MIILQGNKIERSFSGDVLFDNINIQVDERDRIALVGRNGAGKSTLLKILVGEEAPTSGDINTKRDLNLSYLAQDSRFESSKTIYAEMLNVFADLRADENRLRDLMDIKLFVDTDDDIRIIRRIKRDMEERGRSLDSIIEQYISVVKPMYHQFIEPTKRYADVVIPEGVTNTVAIDLINTKVASILEESKKA